MNMILKKQLKKLKKQEEKLLNKEEHSLMKDKISPIKNSIEGKIPKKLRASLKTAFYKGFLLVFEKGNKYIEKFYDKDEKQLQHELNNYAVGRAPSKKRFRNLDKEAKKSKMINATISMVEGTGLGLLGIGLPDIPIFIGVIMKTIYEIALSYGFDYEREEEKNYILLLICVAMTKGEERRKYNEKLEEYQMKIDENLEVQVYLKDQIKVTSDVLSDGLLTAKFIQGLPIVGALGGIVNQTIINKIGKLAEIKYKKRYLLGKIKES